MRSSHHYISHYWRGKKGEEKDIKLEPKNYYFNIQLYNIVRNTVKHNSKTVG